MTFDARQSKHRTGPSGLAFGGMVALMAGCVFTAILSLPQPEPAYALNQVAAHQVKPDNLSVTASAYLDTLKRVAPEKHDVLILTVSTPLPAGQSVNNLAIDHGLDFVRAEIDSAARIPTDQIDIFLDHARMQLWSASHDKHPLCSGQFYADVLHMDGPSSASVSARLNWLIAQNPDLMMGGLTAMIQGIESLQSGAAKPEVRTDLTSQDTIALNGIGRSMAMDEQLLRVFDPLESEEERAKAIEKIDACKLAATTISALKTLPQDTKGRAYNNAIQNFNTGDGDVGTYILKTFFSDNTI